MTRYIQRRMARAYPSLEREQLRRGQKAARAAQEERPHVFAAGCGFYKLACLFPGLLPGDVTETVFCRLTMRIWMSRSSVVYGPFSPGLGLPVRCCSPPSSTNTAPAATASSSSLEPYWAARTNTSAPSSPSWCSEPFLGLQPPALQFGRAR